MKESHKMGLTISLTKIHPSYDIGKIMSNKYLFFKKLYGNYVSYFVKKIKYNL